MFLLSVTLHDYISSLSSHLDVVINMRTARWRWRSSWSKKGSRRQSICSRSMVKPNILLGYYHNNNVCIMSTIEINFKEAKWNTSSLVILQTFSVNLHHILTNTPVPPWRCWFCNPKVPGSNPSRDWWPADLYHGRCGEGWLYLIPLYWFPLSLERYKGNFQGLTPPLYSPMDLRRAVGSVFIGLWLGPSVTLHHQYNSMSLFWFSFQVFEPLKTQ